VCPLNCDVLEIRDLIERWVVYRDAFLWDKFRTLWHEDGVMKATWTEGSFENFIKITAEGLKTWSKHYAQPGWKCHRG
jgi:hypothetical protein